jgi:hypothetical protein
MTSVPSIKRATLQNTIQAELQRDERIEWLGQPDPLRAARAKWYDSAFGLAFISVPLISVVTLSGTSTKAGGGLIGLLVWVIPILFIGIGAFMITSPIQAYLAAQATTHTVTNQRLITIIDRGNRLVISRFAAELSGITRVEYGDGTATLTLERGSQSDSKGRITLVTDDWYGIREGAHVESLIRALIPQPSGNR